MIKNLFIAVYSRTWLWLLIAALIYYIAVWLGNPDYTNWFTIKGVPYSDAARWYEMARNIADGQAIVGGWSAQRPFYSFTIAAFFNWLGSSFTLPVVFNIICASLCVSLIFILGERIFNSVTGWIAAIYFMLNPIVFDILFTITTEIYGVMLLLAGILLLLIGIKHKHWKWWAVSGCVLALSELSRPLAMGLMPAIFLIAVTMKVRWKESFKLVAVLYAAFILTALPWMIRQKIVHDFWGITDDTFESLYATSSPKFGSWDEWIKEEPENLGIRTVADNINFYKNEFFSNLKTQPEVYFTNVRKAYVDFLNLPLDSFFATGGQVGVAAAIFLLFLMILYYTSYLRAEDSKTNLAGTILVYFLLSVVAACLIYLVYQRSLMALLLGLIIIIVQSFKDENKRAFFLFFLFSGISLSLVAETNDYRFLTMVYWEHEMIYASLIGFFVVIVSGRIDPSSGRLRSIKMEYPSRQSLLYIFGIVVLFLTTSLLLMRILVNRPATYDGAKWNSGLHEETIEVLEWIRNRDSSLVDAMEIDSMLFNDNAILLKDDVLNSGRLWFGIGVIGHKVYSIVENEKIDHTARLFQTRDYNCSIVLEDYFATAFDNMALNEFGNRVVMLVNRVNVDTNYIQNEERKLNENLAIIPLNDQFAPVYDDAWVAYESSHLKRLDSLKLISVNTPASTSPDLESFNYNFFNIKAIW